MKHKQRWAGAICCFVLFIVVCLFLATHMKIERRAKEGDFRSNLHRGGAASVASITPQEREIAIKAARTMALDVAGVDILRANRGPLVMEVNASPGLEGIEKTTGIDIAGKMIRWIERHATTEYCLKTGG